MVRKLVPFILCTFFFSCYTKKDIQIRLEKNNDNFNVNDFNNLKFNTLYKLEGIYETKKDFELIYPKLEIHRGTQNYEDYVIFFDDGKVLFFISENLDEAKKWLNKKNDFDAFLYKYHDRNIIKTLQVFKMGGGFGTYNQYLKVINGRVYIQDNYNCSVYILN